MIDDLLDQIHQRYPELVCSAQEKDGSIIFFNKEGLPKLSIVIKHIFGRQITVDLFEYDNKLKEVNL